MVMNECAIGWISLHSYGDVQKSIEIKVYQEILYVF